MTRARPPSNTRRLGSVLVVLATLGLSMTACSDTGSDDSAGSARDDATGDRAGEREPRDEPPGDPAPTIDRADVDAGIDKVPGEVRKVLEASGVPGAAVAIVYDDEVVFAEGFGVRSLDTGDPVDTETVFQIASLSKPISATVVSELVAEGKLGWDDPVIDYTPDFALGDPAVTQWVSPADLFSHRSGLPDHAGDLLEDLGYDRGYVLSRLAMEPLGEFRNDYAYTNYGLTAGAVAAATAAGGQWETVAEETLFEPAGMDHSTYSFTEFMSKDNRAEPHVRNSEGEWVVGAQRMPQAQSPAGGVSSNIEDLAKFVRIQLADGRLGDRTIVAKTPDSVGALEAMRTPRSLSSPPRSPSANSGFYGYGLNVDTRDDGFVSLSHSGAFAMGAATAVLMIPGQDLGVVTITNGQPVGAPEAINQIVADLVIDGEVTKDWYGLYNGVMEQLYVPTTPTDWTAEVADPSAQRAGSAYVGTYTNDYYGPMEVREGPDGLEMTLGPESMAFPLTAYDGDSFLFTPPGENSTGPTGITFAVEGDVATSANSEFYDETGLGTWQRA
ncbi:MAG: serine hydrolase [Microthrixaceae bacterium]